MSLRRRVALAMAAIAAATALTLGVASYRSTRARLLAEVDRSLVALDATVELQRGGDDDDRGDLPTRGPLSGFGAQLLDANGVVRRSNFPIEMPVTDAARDVAGRRSARFDTVETSEGAYRVRTVGSARGAVQIGRPLDETERVLASLRRRTLLLGGLVTALAAAAGLWISTRVTASLRRLTAAAEHVESTGRLDVSIGDDGADEVGRLSVAFDRMLGALARSQDQQQRLVQDAGHELRTPLTSLRTNLDALRRFPEMGAADRDAIVADLHAETEELTSLVNEVIAAASGAMSDEPVERFDLDAVVAEVVERYRRRAERSISLSAGGGGTVVAQRAGVQRAVSCLLDNAVKFDAGAGPIDVEVRGGDVTVSDRGPGVPDADLVRIFDRFHRSDTARTMPGSGLGLSIVRDVARRHGGVEHAANRRGGGAEIGFRLPLDDGVGSATDRQVLT